MRTLSKGSMFRVAPTVLENEDGASAARGVVDLARAGDCEAFGEVCRFYETRLMNQAMTLCQRSELAEDLAQDTLVEAWKSLPRYNGRCQFFTWLCAILLNRYRNTLRQKRPLAFSFFTGHDRDDLRKRLENVADLQPLPDHTYGLREQALLLRTCIQNLPAKHQQVVYLRFYVDASLEDIASSMGCSVGTVKSRLFNALEKLRRMRALDAERRDHQ